MTYWREKPREGAHEFLARIEAGEPVPFSKRELDQTRAWGANSSVSVKRPCPSVATGEELLARLFDGSLVVLKK